MLMVMQVLDALFLLGIVGCILVILAEDETYRHGWPRVGLLILGTTVFAQAMWLVGVWIPGVTGYPIPRLLMDGSMLGLSMYRAFMLIRAAECGKRRERNGSYAL